MPENRFSLTSNFRIRPAFTIVSLYWSEDKGQRKQAFWDILRSVYLKKQPLTKNKSDKNMIVKSIILPYSNLLT